MRPLYSGRYLGHTSHRPANCKLSNMCYIIERRERVTECHSHPHEQFIATYMYGLRHSKYVVCCSLAYLSSWPSTKLLPVRAKTRSGEISVHISPQFRFSSTFNVFFSLNSTSARIVSKDEQTAFFRY